MVNKGTFFQRLKDRWGSGSGVRVEQPSETAANAAEQRAGGSKPGAKPAPRTSAGPTAGRVDEARQVSSSFQPAEARSSRKMSEREEAMMAFGQHFQELTKLMRGAQAASDEKLQKIMRSIHSQCVEFGVNGAAGPVNYVKGANLAGFVKVAKAMLAYGVV